MRTSFAVTTLLTLSLVACSMAEPVSPVPGDAPALSAVPAGQTIVHFQTTFTATALCGSPIGDIRFSGLIEGVDHTTVDDRGETHRTRSFRVQGLSGWLLPETVFDETTVDFRVKGGAEMLNWNTQSGQVPGVAARSMHAGTLVFDPINDGPKVVAHHSIRYVENAQGDIVVSFSDWRCR